MSISKMSNTNYPLSLSPQPYSPLSSGGESGSGSDSPPTIPPKRKAGRKKFKETRHPVYHGVRQRDSGKWVCEMREPNKKTRIWVGTYLSPELAARAYDVAALALGGNLAALNFPDSAWLAPRAKSSSARDIRLAALQATRMDLISSSSSLPSSSKGSKSEQDKEGSKKSEMECVMKKDLEDSRRMFLDEEAIFNMPCLIDSMAEAMLLTPPALKRGTTWDDFDESANSFIELDLWR